MSNIYSRITERFGFNTMRDGIINEKIFNLMNIKLCFLLKEVNDENGYDQREAFRKLVKQVRTQKSLKNIGRNKWWYTLDPIIYISYLAFNNYMKWVDVDYIRDNWKMVEVLEKIAYLNIKKTPGESKSKYEEIRSAFEQGKDIIEDQLEEVGNCVVYCGGTLQYLKEYYSLNESNEYKLGDVKYYKSNGKIFIDGYHPNFIMRLSEKDGDKKGTYIDTIVSIIKEYYSENSGIAT